MLAPALINVADRLTTLVMVLVDAISPIVLGGSTPTFADHAAQTLFFRLSRLVTTLIRISNFGVRAPATPAKTNTNTNTNTDPITQRSGPALTLPRRPGWLLAALPDNAPAIAADLEALLADPDLTALLVTVPTLHRILRPLLRGLGLVLPHPPQPDPTRTVGCPAPHQSHSPTPPAEATAPSAIPPAASNRPTGQSPFHAHIITI